MSAFTREAVIAECFEYVRQVVTLSPGVTTRAKQRAAARLLRLRISRLIDWWQGEVKLVEAHEADQIRYYAAEARRVADQKARDFNQRRDRAVAGAPAVVVRLAPREIRRTQSPPPRRKKGSPPF